MMIIILICFLLLSIQQGYCTEDSQWRVWATRDGLAELYSRSLTIDASETVTINHGSINQISILDGFGVSTIPGAGDGATVKESLTGELWANYNLGGLQKFQDGEWIIYPIINFVFRTTPFIPTYRDRVLYLYNNTLIEFNAQQRESRDVVTAGTAGLGQIADLIESREGGVWLTGRNGAVRVQPTQDEDYREVVVENYLFDSSDRLRDLANLIDNGNGRLFGVAWSEEKGRETPVYHDGENWREFSYLPEQTIIRFWGGVDQDYWFHVRTPYTDFLIYYHLDKAKIVESNNVLIRSFNSVVPEPSGRFWVTTGEGVTHYQPGSWRKQIEFDNADPTFYSIHEDLQQRVWFTSPDSLVMLDQGEWKHYKFPDKYAGEGGRTASVGSFRDGTVAVRCKSEILLFNPESESFSVFNDPRIGFISIMNQRDEDSFFVAWRGPDELDRYQLGIFDGESIRQTLDFSDYPFLSDIRVVYEDSSGTLWIGTVTSLWRAKDGVVEQVDEDDGFIGRGAFSIVEIGQGKLWVGERDNILEYDGTRWKTIKQNEIEKVRAMIKADDGSLWLTSHAGVHRYWNGTLVTSTNDDGLPKAPVYSIFEDSKERIWVGTTKGFYLYDKRADLQPPETVINTLQSSAEVTEGLEGFFVFSGFDKWKHTEKERLLYSYRFDEQEWSIFTADTVVSASTFKPGKHQFEVRAMDRNWNIDPAPAVLQFLVSPIPIQKRAWFKLAVVSIILIIILLGGAAGIFAYIARLSQQQVLKQRNALQWLSESILGPQKAKEIGRTVAEEARRLFQYDAFALDIFDPMNSNFIEIYSEDTYANGHSPMEVQAYSYPKYGEFAQQILGGETRLINRDEEPGETPFTPFGCESRLSRSLMFVPLRWRKHSIGILTVQSYTPNRYKEEDLQILQSFADLCAGAFARLQTEEKLRQREEQLRQAQKMEALGTLAGGIAHDFNNILTAIMGYSDLLLYQLDVNDRKSQIVSEIYKAGGRAQSLTRQLLAFCRKQILTPKISNLNIVIEDLKSMLDSLISENIELEYSLQDNLPNCQFDWNQIEQVVMNLIINARDAIHDVGTITLETQAVEVGFEAPLPLEEMKPGNYVVLKVSDTGGGIPKSALSMIFDPFFTTKEQGTGLGLSTVYGIVKQSNGFITVDSAVGVGTTFMIYFPAVEHEVQVKERPSKTISKFKSNATVVLIEDDEIVLEFVQKVLLIEGLNVLTASDGQEAAEMIEKYTGRIDLILTDIVLPRLNGVELVNRVKPNLASTKIIFMSGYADDYLERFNIPRDEFQILPKPFTKDQLLKVLHSVLEDLANDSAKGDNPNKGSKS